MTGDQLAAALERLAQDRDEHVASYRVGYLPILREAAARLRADNQLVPAVHRVYGEGVMKEAPMETTKIKCPTCHREVGVDAESRKVLFHLRQSATGAACPSSLLSVVLVTGGRVR